jgi:cytochrome o ubiquinol oxidase subunit 2
MSKFRLIFFLAFTAGTVLFIAYLLRDSTFALFEPKGIIALQERTLMLNAILLMLIVVIPVYLLTVFFVWRYRASNTSAKYMPNWEHAKMDELIWWAIPFEIILVLGALTWTSTHALDPYKQIHSDTKPLSVEVVALDWKWLFIYPEQSIATVNELTIPAHTPINFKITADAPMNSFWIPELGSQIYAMTGMVTPLSLMATETGTFKGLSANYSGAGFSGMRFAVKSIEPDEFETWVTLVQERGSALNQSAYEVLAEPSENEPVAYFGGVQDGFFNSIVMKFNHQKDNSAIQEEGLPHSHAHTIEQTETEELRVPQPI